MFNTILPYDKQTKSSLQALTYSYLHLRYWGCDIKCTIYKVDDNNVQIYHFHLRYLPNLLPLCSTFNINGAIQFYDIHIYDINNLRSSYTKIMLKLTLPQFCSTFNMNADTQIFDTYIYDIENLRYSYTIYTKINSSLILKYNQY